MEIFRALTVNGQPVISVIVTPVFTVKSQVPHRVYVPPMLIFELIVREELEVIAGAKAEPE
jgi:hypothetical protein